MKDWLHKNLYLLFVKPVLKFYLKKQRTFKYKNLNLKIYPGVFHPAYFFSTTLFADFIEALPLEGKSVCEVGAGSGLLSFLAYSKKANVCALDINTIAVKGLKENLAVNFDEGHGFCIYQSDLFDTIPVQIFDVVLINPPYFFSDPKSEASRAWYCGKNGEFFTKFFSQLSRFTHSQSRILMVLAEVADISRIKKLAAFYGFRFNIAREEKVKWEKNYIYYIEKAVKKQTQSIKDGFPENNLLAG